MKVKICGVTRIEDAMASARLGADALGFNFAEEAKRRNRYLDPETARGIVDALPPFVSVVAVTVNASMAEIDRYLDFADFVQLHGEEPPEMANAIGRRAIKAFRLTSDSDLDRLERYHSVGAWLLDASVPGEHGGTGQRADWTLAMRAASIGMPVILAGGLTPANVSEAVQAVAPYGVDVASGVESEPGKKDHEYIRQFIENARIPVS
jgi:phosphoribosylanthranilate isomerase